MQITAASDDGGRLLLLGVASCQGMKIPAFVGQQGRCSGLGLDGSDSAQALLR